jgi:hypothetical protein
MEALNVCVVGIVQAYNLMCPAECWEGVNEFNATLFEWDAGSVFPKVRSMIKPVTIGCLPKGIQA